MKAAISIVLAGMVVMVPLKQVQAQAELQQAVGVYRAVSPDGAAHRLRVQPLTESGALLWQPMVTQSESSPLPDFVDWRGTIKDVAIVAAVVAIAAALVLVIFAILFLCPEDARPGTNDCAGSEGRTGN